MSSTATPSRGNAVGVALRPPPGWASRGSPATSIHDNGKDVLRCWSGGSCDPQLRRGGIVFGIPAQEHAAYVGERGGGVPVDPAKFTQICPDGAPDCQGPPNHGIAPPVIDKVVRNGNDPDGERTGPSLRVPPARRSSCSATATPATPKARSFSAKARDQPACERAADVFHDGRRPGRRTSRPSFTADDDDEPTARPLNSAGRWDVGLAQARG